MLADDIQQTLTKRFADAQVELKIDGNHLYVVIVSDEFEGLSPVKRQQLVYALLQDEIASGAVHAVHMQTLTPSQYQQQ